jgi:hypothetical protein
MADSENSRTLPSNTPGNLLPVAERFLICRADQQGGDIATGSEGSLARWSAWFHAHGELTRLGRAQQRLEAKMLALAAIPQVEITVPGRGGPTVVHSFEEIETWFVGDGAAEARSEAKAELLALRRKWEAADLCVGYSAAKQAEDAAADLESRLLEDLWNTPALSIVTAAAKLHAVICQGSPKPDSDDFPWPQARSVLRDLVGLAGGLPYPREDL